MTQAYNEYFSVLRYKTQYKQEMKVKFYLIAAFQISVEIAILHNLPICFTHLSTRNVEEYSSVTVLRRGNFH